MPNLQIPEKLLPLVQKKKRFKIVIGGRGGGKSQTIAGLLLGRIAKFGEVIACCREFQNSIDDSVHSLLVEQIDQLKAPEFSVQATKIMHSSGGGAIYKGLARNPDSIKSMHGASVAWVEEAQNLSKESIKILTPTIREAGSEIWMSANPRYANDPFSLRFIKPWEAELRQNGYYEDDLHLVIFLNYYDNPWFPADLEAERQYDYEHKPRAEYNHVWLGHYGDTVENAIILPEWFDAAVDAHIKLKIQPVGAEVVSLDPSDRGEDAKGLVHRHGIHVKEAAAREFGDVNDSADWALGMATEHHVDHFVWDADGMGLALRRQVTQALIGRRTAIHEFRGSGAVDAPNQIYDDILPTGAKQKTNKEAFRNKRAQYYWMLRDRFRDTWQAVEKKKYIDPARLISIDSSIDGMDILRSEACRIPLKPNPMGFIQIMTKQEMRQNKIQSPNIMDAFMMSQAIQSTAVRAKTPARPVQQRARGAW